MDFESPDVMKDFPGLYSTESGKKNNDSEYSDDSNDKVTKKDLLIGKRKDKKDNKKDRGYAALEGESSAEEDCETKSPSKTKKTKSFKFSSKNKEKREKDKKGDKEKDGDKKKEKDSRKFDRNKEKVKCDKKERKVKHINDDKNNIEDVLPIFGVSLQEAVSRSRCHDGVDLPLPIRDCIDYLEVHGKTFENVYKINGIKSKVLHIKKLYNQRESVNLEEYDVPTITSVFKMFLRELPEPILGDALTRFEEAAAVQNVSTRETNLVSLVNKLPVENKTLLSWTILHLDYITFNEKHTKMNAQGIAMTLSPVLQMSHRLLAALLCHCKSLFKDTVICKYCPPLSITSTVQLPEDSDAIQDELRKQESLILQIHYEMNSGYVSKKREELLWEVQRMITQLKRKLRSIQKCNDASKNIQKEEHSGESSKITKSLSCSDDDTFQLKNNKSKLHLDDTSEATTSNNSIHYENARIDNTSESDTENLVPNDSKNSDSENQDSLEQKLTCDIQQHTTSQTTINVQNVTLQPSNNVPLNLNAQQNPHTQNTNITHNLNVQASASGSVPHNLIMPAKTDILQQNIASQTANVKSALNHVTDSSILHLQHQNQLLIELKESLVSQIAAEKAEVVYLKYCLGNYQQVSDSNINFNDCEKIEEIMDLLTKENRILKIKKTDLVREIMENREACVALKTKLFMSTGVR